MEKEKREKIVFVCYLVASICYFVCAIIGIFSENNSTVVVNLCLGSAFLCLSTTHLNKDKNKKDK